MRSMIKAFAILGSVVLALAFAAPLSAAPPGKTKICHFPNHWAYLGPPYNFAVFDSVLEGEGGFCLEVGGQIMEISNKAMKGHLVDADVLFPNDFEKCILCHFPGHEEGDWIDSVLTNGAGGFCYREGGMVIVTSCNAVAGHEPWCNYNTHADFCDSL